MLAGVTLLATLAVASACSNAGTDRGTPTGPGSGSAFNDADVALAQMMIMHRQQGVEMAALAQTRAADPQLRQVAAQIKADQDQQIATMMGWLATWDQPTTQPGGHNMSGMSGVPGMMADQEMAQLRGATGADFDRMFARMMIAHHNGSMQVCRDLQGTGSNAGAKALASTIEQSQAAEVAALQGILDRL
ncbi:MAG: DUF305 domain-containing protein [Sporichthyaceae bacterium]|nr:DUF305 domain-containing protein [Sporichthyaceae bacterium]